MARRLSDALLACPKRAVCVVKPTREGTQFCRTRFLPAAIWQGLAVAPLLLRKQIFSIESKLVWLPTTFVDLFRPLSMHFLLCTALVSALQTMRPHIINLLVLRAHPGSEGRF